jgi:hypothetical protein
MQCITTHSATKGVQLDCIAVPVTGELIYLVRARPALPIAPGVATALLIPPLIDD